MLKSDGLTDINGSGIMHSQRKDYFYHSLCARSLDAMKSTAFFSYIKFLLHSSQLYFVIA